MKEFGREVSKMTYRPEIDGLRAVAVVPVLLFHAGFGFPGGYAGVDVFFVISGYLIGAHILRDAVNERFRFVDFWMRRLRRLFPAWAVTTAVTAAAAFIWLVPPHLAQFGESLIAQPLLWANFHFYGESGYFETASEFQPLLHTWSLAVEEQFYVLLPLVLVPILRGARRFLVPVIVGSILISFVIALWFSRQDPSLAFFLLPARIWELDLGVLLALLQSRGFRISRGRSTFAAGGLLLIFLSYSIFDGNTAFPGPWAILPCLGTASFLLANTNGLTGSGKILSSPPLVWIGKISYPLYLWHWPVLVYFRYLHISEPPAHLLALALGLSFLLAWVTYRWVEEPVRSRRVLGATRSLGGVAVAFAFLFLAIGLAASKSDGFPGRFPAAVNAHLVESPKHPDAFDISDWETRGGPSILGDSEGASVELIVWGDSHALTLASVLDRLGKEHGVRVILAAEAGIAPVPGTYPTGRGPESLAITETVLRTLDHHPDAGILFVAKWTMYLQGRNDGEYDRLLREKRGATPDPDSARAVFRDRFHELLSALDDSGRDLWVMRSVPFQSRSVPETLAQLASRGRDLNTFARPLEEHAAKEAPTNAAIDAATSDTSAQVLDPHSMLADSSGLASMARDGKSLYRDRDHLSDFGAEQLIPLLEPLFFSITKAKD